jgi:hypothetical protein
MATIDIGPLLDGFHELSRDEAREAAGRAFSRSQEVLYGQGDDHEYDVYPVAQSGQPPEWDASKGGFVFSYPHEAAIFFEVGTEPHEIEAVRAEMLKFEWPDAPAEVQQMFEATFPTVFFRSVDHPGTPALGYVQAGMDEAARYLEGRG